jgi:hypothetical protein
MSAHRIKIKARRKARQQAASTSNSPITPSDIFGSPAIDLDEDDVEFPFPPGECPWYVPTDEEDERIIEKWRRSKNSAQAVTRPLCASDMDAQAARRPLCASNMDTQAVPRPSCVSNMDTPAASAAPGPTPAASTPAPVQPAPGQSTGPRTAEGKARSSHNAFKHGLSMFAGKSMTFLPREDSDAHTLLLLQFNQQFVPMTAAEKELVREIVDTLWLARRARDLQTEAIIMADHQSVALYLRYETAHQRAHTTAIKTLLTVQKDRRLRNQNHEKWDEPVLWDALDFIALPGSEPAMSAYSPATTSPASTGYDSSFRNPLSMSSREFADASPIPSQTVLNSTSEEVNLAA